MEAKQNIIQNIIYDDEKTQLINEFKEKIKLQPQIQKGINALIEHHKKEIKNISLEQPVTDTDVYHIRKLLDEVRVATLDSELCGIIVNGIEFIDLMDISDFKFNIHKLSWFYGLYVPYCKV